MVMRVMERMLEKKADIAPRTTESDASRPCGRPGRLGQIGKFESLIIELHSDHIGVL